MAFEKSAKRIAKALGLTKNQITFIDTLPLTAYPFSVSYSYAAGASNVTEVTITVKDYAGNTVASAVQLDVHLSDAATGLGVTGTTASGTVTNKTSSGTVLAAITAKKVLRVQTKTDGTFVLEITDSAKTGFYVATAIPATGALNVSRQLVSGDYGA